MTGNLHDVVEDVFPQLLQQVVSVFLEIQHAVDDNRLPEVHLGDSFSEKFGESLAVGRLRHVRLETLAHRAVSPAEHGKATQKILFVLENVLHELIQLLMWDGVETTADVNVHEIQRGGIGPASRDERPQPLVHVIGTQHPRSESTPITPCLVFQHLKQISEFHVHGDRFPSGIWLAILHVGDRADRGGFGEEPQLGILQGALSLGSDSRLVGVYALENCATQTFQPKVVDFRPNGFAVEEDVVSS